MRLSEPELLRRLAAADERLSALTHPQRELLDRLHRDTWHEVTANRTSWAQYSADPYLRVETLERLLDLAEALA